MLLLYKINEIILSNLINLDINLKLLPNTVHNRILFYHYYFEGIEKPLIIEAENKREASQYVLDHINRLPVKDGIVVYDLKITSPIFGVTEKVENDIVFIWCSKDYSESGWMEKELFEKQNIYLNDQQR